MRTKKASGAIGMMLAMLIIAILFILMMPTLKNIGGTNLGGNSLNKENIEEHVNRQAETIEQIRRQSIEYQKNVMQEY